MVICCVVGCSNRTGKKAAHQLEKEMKTRISFHKFPTDEDLRQVWIDAIRRKDWTPHQTSFVCSEHFDENCFDASSLYRKLKLPAIPTIFPIEYNTPSTSMNDCLSTSTFQLNQNCDSKEIIITRGDKIVKFTLNSDHTILKQLKLKSDMKQRRVLSLKEIAQNVIISHNREIILKKYEKLLKPQQTHVGQSNNDSAQEKSQNKLTSNNELKSNIQVKSPRTINSENNNIELNSSKKLNISSNSSQIENLTVNTNLKPLQLVKVEKVNIIENIRLDLQSETSSNLNSLPNLKVARDSNDNQCILRELLLNSNSSSEIVSKSNPNIEITKLKSAQTVRPIMPKPFLPFELNIAPNISGITDLQSKTNMPIRSDIVVIDIPEQEFLNQEKQFFIKIGNKLFKLSAGPQGTINTNFTPKPVKEQIYNNNNQTETNLQAKSDALIESNMSKKSDTLMESDTPIESDVAAESDESVDSDISVESDVVVECDAVIKSDPHFGKESYPIEFLDVEKHKSGKPLLREQKLRAYKIYNRYRQEESYSKTTCVDNAACEMGIGKKTLWKIIKEMETTGKIAPIVRKRKKRSQLLYENDRKKLKDIISSIHTDNTLPTLRTIMQAVKNQDLPKMSISTLYRYIKSLGYTYDKRSKKNTEEV